MATTQTVPADRFVSDGITIAVDVFTPAGTGRHPATVIFYGTFGLLPPYRDDILSFGTALAAKGIVAFLPHYFERTGTAPGPDALTTIGRHYATWRRTCADALLFARSHARAVDGRLGVLGFSLGGHMALSLGMAPPADVTPACVVDFFGPVITPPLTGKRAAMPPLLIHHGLDDDLVTIDHSRQLASELRAAGKTEGADYTLLEYPGQGHAFVGGALTTARTKSVEFLTSILELHHV
jgi:dienelactone hydrolase